MKEWLKNLFSLEERKASAVMFGFICFIIMGLYVLFKTQNIPINLVYLILGLGGYVCGYNVIPQLMSNGNQNSYNNIVIPEIKNISDNINTV